MLRPFVLVRATCRWMSEYGALVELHWRRKKHSTRRKCQFAHHKSHTGSTADYRGDRPATNRLSQGTAVYAVESIWASDRHVSTRPTLLTEHPVRVNTAPCTCWRGGCVRLRTRQDIVETHLLFPPGTEPRFERRPVRCDIVCLPSGQWSNACLPPGQRTSTPHSTINFLSTQLTRHKP